MANNANPTCDLYLSGHDCVTEMDNITCLSCRDFYEIDYAADTRAEVTTPAEVFLTEADLLDAQDGYDPHEPWMD